MIMMMYAYAGPSLQLTGNADFWHPTGVGGAYLILGVGLTVACILVTTFILTRPPMD